MSQQNWPHAIGSVIAKGRVEPADVARLRATVYGNAVVSAEEAEWAFAVEIAAKEGCREWTEFFLESLTDFYVWQQAPEGYVTEEGAAGLVRAAAPEGVVTTANQLELVVRILEKSSSSPPSLSAFALRQVQAAVVQGRGPLTARPGFAEGAIGAAEVELVRRILFAFGGHEGIAISRAEAEVLFDLNDQTREAENHPSWSDLFVKAIAHFLMAARGYRVPSREEALRREAWLDAPSLGLSSIFGEMLVGLLSGSVFKVWHERPVPVLPPEGVALTADEVKWLAERIGRDGDVHLNERALLRFISEEGADLHPSLRTLLDTAA